MAELYRIGNSGSVEYIYDATGTKLAQKVGGSLTYYRGPMVYQGNALELIFLPEGTITWANGMYIYNYFKTDHTGSTRKMLYVTRTSGYDIFATLQSTDYYPFGLAHSGPNDLTRNRYLYSGKEYQNVSVSSDGSLLGLYDFGARYYDPLLGRWFNPDPALQGLNPYVYCGNNPIMFVDKDGEFFFSLIVPWFKMLIASINGDWQAMTTAGAQAALDKLWKTTSNPQVFYEYIPNIRKKA